MTFILLIQENKTNKNNKLKMLHKVLKTKAVLQ